MKTHLTFGEAMEQAVTHRKRPFRDGAPNRKIAYYVSPPELFFPGETAPIQMLPFLVLISNGVATPYIPSMEDILAGDWCTP